MNLTIRRITKARRARDKAQNAEFKAFWQNVIDQLVAKLD